MGKWGGRGKHDLEVGRPIRSIQLCMREEDVKKIGEPKARDKKSKFSVEDEVGFSKVVL